MERRLESGLVAANCNEDQRRSKNAMSAEEREDTTIYKVVVNHEEQYSIWPAHRENALGWKDAGKTGTKEECLAYIKEVWTDMRPLSLRKRMEEMAGSENKQ
jgi:MbtH protein